jgi:hypothetical protein
VALVNRKSMFGTGPSQQNGRDGRAVSFDDGIANA